MTEYRVRAGKLITPCWYLEKKKKFLFFTYWDEVDFFPFFSDAEEAHGKALKMLKYFSENNL